MPLTIVLNKCIQEAIFPSMLKVGKVVPIFKKGDKNKCENYRPISILPAISKVFEEAIKSRLMKFLEDHKMLTPNQHGYRRGHSTTSGILQIVEHVYRAFDEGMWTEMNMIDLTKAFDSVNHEVLLNKLEYYGVRGGPLDLLRSYLTNRVQLTEWNNTRSQHMNIYHGVPQGSVLGPLLFVLYVNDLPSNIVGAEICLYADDTSVLVEAEDLETLCEKSRKAMVETNKWFTANKLQVNMGKTQSLLFSTRNSQISTARFLGMTVDTNLKWNQHIDDLASKLSSTLFALKRLTYVATHQAAKTAYYSSFHSLLSYGILFWGSMAEAQRIFVLQKRAVRYLCNLKYNESCRTRFREEQILTLSSVFILAVVTHVHKNRDAFPQNGINHEYETRRRAEIRVPHHRLAATQRSLDYWGGKLYNRLPHEVKILPFAAFKKRVKKTLMETEPYTLEEFLT